jgi:hypothetical protein
MHFVETTTIGANKYKYFHSICCFFYTCCSTVTRIPPKIGKNKIFWCKIVIFHTKYPKNFRASLRSAPWNPGSAPAHPRVHSWFDSKIVHFYTLFYWSYFPYDRQNGTRSSKTNRTDKEFAYNIRYLKLVKNQRII